MNNKMEIVKSVNTLHVVALTTLILVILFFRTHYQFSFNYASKYRQKNVAFGNANAEVKPFVANEESFKDTPTQCKYLSTLGNTVLAVNFNHPHYALVPLLKEFYNPLFGKVVFCGSGISKEHDIIQIPGQYGFQGYDCLRKAMELNPVGYSGYMHTNDDVILNYWNLNFDPNKIWIGEEFLTFKSHVMGEPLRTDWMWWKEEKAAERCERTFQILAHVQKDDIDLRTHFDNYYNNTGGKHICIPGNSDFFYIPLKYAKTYRFLASIFAREKVFLEVAVPMMLTFLDRYELFENLNGIYYVYYQPPHNNFYYVYNFSTTFAHPFKMDGSLANQKFFELAWGAYGHSQNLNCKQKMQKN